MTSSIYLSILIPVYNWDIRKLLKLLHIYCDDIEEDLAIEIIALDDASSEKQLLPQEVIHYPLLRYEILPENKGRGIVRNLLIEKAKGKYVLFLDADMLPDNSSFLERYVAMAQSRCEIVCGGISYLQNTMTGKDYSFYLYKSSKTEAVSIKKRCQAPWRYMFTSNIMLRRSIVSSVSFEKRFTGYGFEDIEWAIRLGKMYSLVHIDNTCTHMGVMTKHHTFSKMRESVDNYALLLALHPSETKRSSAALVSNMLKIFPRYFLETADGILKKLFFAINWNPLSFIIFQLNKMVLLANARK